MLDTHIVPEGYGLMPTFTLFGIRISSYAFCVGLALLAGLLCFLLLSRKNQVNKLDRLLILLSALMGGVLGSKIPILITRWNAIFADPLNMNILWVEKSIIGGLIGGFFSVVLVKKLFGIKIRMGNDIAPAAALGMAIGRVGCFLTGCCYGKATGTAYGVDFGDGVLRYPTQLYEIIFDLGLFAVLLYLRQKTSPKDGILFRYLLNGYLTFRFFNEFLRDSPTAVLFFTYYQLICIFCLLFINRKKILAWIRKHEKNIKKEGSQTNV